MEDNLFDRLNDSHQQSAEWAAAQQEQALARAQTRQRRLLDVLETQLAQNKTLPVYLTSIDVKGGASTNTAFLKSHLDPLLTRPFTLQGLFRELDATTDALGSFGVFDSLSYTLDVAPPTLFAPPEGVSPLTATLHLKEGKRLLLRTGTDLGNGEGSAYASASLKNVFGNAEKLTFDASSGTRTRSSYVLDYSTPLKHSARWKASLTGVKSSRDCHWASHEQVLRGVTAKVAGTGFLGGRHEFGYEALWRTLTGVADSASATVRADAGDSFKSAVFHSWALDTRDNVLFPTEGAYFKIQQEFAGAGSLLGDVKFSKHEATAVVAKALFNDNVLLSLGARGGLLYGLGPDAKTSVLDRFYLGGPNDVRGFYLNGLGPKDGADSVGGEAFAAGGISLFTRLPMVSRESPLRLQTFVNAGSLLPLKKGEWPVRSANPDDTQATLNELLDKPSVAGGIGLVYNHPVARFELNFVLPLAVREGDSARKGLQFGLGMSFL
ncbi:surface antigen-domain-containing protein, partial [Dipodascopsis tothii]|uniref:surface antigen-domain-containing protein n=1 Tax=Dipodascopsis tothii TaxID=44089 RepID=UPI0034CE02D7